MGSGKWCQRKCLSMPSFTLTAGVCVFRRSRLPNSRRRISGLLWRRSRRPKLKRSVREIWVLDADFVCFQFMGQVIVTLQWTAVVNDSCGHNSLTHTHRVKASTHHNDFCKSVPNPTQRLWINGVDLVHAEAESSYLSVLNLHFDPVYIDSGSICFR